MSLAEGGFDLALYPHVRDWTDRIEAQPGYIALEATT